VRSELFHMGGQTDRHTDRHDEADSRFEILRKCRNDIEMYLKEKKKSREMWIVFTSTCISELLWVLRSVANKEFFGFLKDFTFLYTFGLWRISAWILFKIHFVSRIKTLSALLWGF